MKAKTFLIRFWATLACTVTLGAIFFLFAYIFANGAHVITWKFLTDIPRGLIIGTEGGILPAIVGSLWYTGIACAFATVLGIGTAICQVFYCKNEKLSGTIAMVMQCMAGVPSIVMGLFGYSLLVLAMGWGKCILAGGITQGIMILPFIQVRAEKALREIDVSQVHASYAMGASRGDFGRLLRHGRSGSADLHRCGHHVQGSQECDEARHGSALPPVYAADPGHFCR